MHGDLLICNVEVDRRRADVVVRGSRIVAVEPSASNGSTLNALTGDVVIDGDGGALIPGLHDHHLHLMSAAAARDSIDLAYSDGTAATTIADAARTRAPGTWLRVVGYHESMGHIDRRVLDAVAPDHPVKVQHRSGAMWVLNSAAFTMLGPALASAPSGVQRDASGEPTGECFRVDDWLQGHLPSTPPDLHALAREVRSFGVTGVTDMTPYRSVTDMQPLLDADLPLRLTVTGGPELTSSELPPFVAVGPVKLLFDDHDLPDFAGLVDVVRRAHDAGRPVAVHSVTRASAAYMVAVWQEAGTHPGDRLEHGAVVPGELAIELGALGVTVVTQPAFVARRGDQYLAEVDADDLPFLWPLHSLLHAGVAVAAGTDAPFGPGDPWVAIAAATERRTPSGRSLGPCEVVTARQALDLFLGTPLDPGRSRRRVAAGEPADLCLLDRPLADALAAPSSRSVRCTWLGGEPLPP